MALNILLFSIPEALAVAWLVQILSGSKVFWVKTASVGVLTGLVTGLFRPLIGYFPLNMLIYAFLLVVLFAAFKAEEAWKLVVSVAFAIPIYLLTEFLCILFIMSVFHVSPAEFGEQTTLKFVCFLPQLSITIIIALLFLRFNVNLFFKNPLDKEV